MEFREWFEAEEKLKEGFGTAAVLAFIQSLIRQIVPDGMMPAEDQIIQIANQIAMHFHISLDLAMRLIQQYFKSTPLIKHVTMG
jgi:hypothetical protein